ncbi:SDR family oxidoreductase [Acetobacteraceae bacterium KSS8]|uniref:SDR family oxidoreductase n=1 Tax=Endosaccharibacter trunci TaxID=2812733 RepID=A0ABT1W564_9PROT|nr:SDR family oxidoreductase [Acetobacteraceae bacterium KSS8]
MRVFVTGATGFVGSALVQELLSHGHQVLGLSRSAEKGAGLAASGAEVLHGTLDDTELLRDTAGQVDAVAHLGFNHDFSRFAENCALDERAIAAIGGGLSPETPFLVTSGVALLARDRPATEADRHPDDLDFPRRSEKAARTLAARGLRAGTVRLPPTTHGIGDHGFVAMLAARAWETGVSGFVEEADISWAATHCTDAAQLFRLALEDGVRQPVYHAIAEQGVPFRQIADAIGRAMKVPVEPRPPAHFGWMAPFVSTNMAATGEQTAARLGWKATGPDLLSDLADPRYFTTD